MLSILKIVLTCIRIMASKIKIVTHYRFLIRNNLQVLKIKSEIISENNTTKAVFRFKTFGLKALTFAYIDKCPKSYQSKRLKTS